MDTYSMTCTCGHVMSVTAATREDAVEKMKAMMNEEAIAAHMTEKHPGEPVTPMSQVHATIDQNLQKV